MKYERQVGRFGYLLHKHKAATNISESAQNDYNNNIQLKKDYLLHFPNV